MPFRKSPEVARELGISYSRLFYLVTTRKIQAPAKDQSGDYYWLDDDVERARQALARRGKGVCA